MTSDSGNLYGHLRPILLGHGPRPALRLPSGGAWRFGDLELWSGRFLGYLESLGLTPGDRVSAQVEKSAQALCLYLACLRGGFVFHPLNPAYTPDELDYFLGNAEPTLVVCDSARETLYRELMARHAIPHLLIMEPNGSGELYSAARGLPMREDVRELSGDAPAVLLYSSGTTGVPKGIALSHDNLFANAADLLKAWGFSHTDVLLHALPIYHVHGLLVATHCALFSGACMHWLPKFSVPAVLEALPTSTVMMGVPTYYTRLLDSEDFDAQVCRNMRLFISGSAPLLEGSFHAFEARTGHRILERYGMSETGMNASNPLDGERRPGSVGPPLPGVEARVVDDQGAELPPGEVGELQVRGRNVFSGYWRLADRIAEDFTDDGFFRTGDQAAIAADGYVSIVGRARDMVISGGLNVYPKEVENALDAHPQVTESAVIGVPHADYGEAVVAVLVPATKAFDSAQVLADLGRGLAGYKLPQRLVIVEALPRNSMGKVQKGALRERYRDLLA